MIRNLFCKNFDFKYRCENERTCCAPSRSNDTASQKNRFYGFWSFQRPTLSVRVKLRFRIKNLLRNFRFIENPIFLHLVNVKDRLGLWGCSGLAELRKNISRNRRKVSNLPDLGNDVSIFWGGRGAIRGETFWAPQNWTNFSLWITISD